jgi:exodeoxyribonuclease X
MTIYRALDFETTGLPVEGGEPTGMMEAGWCDMRFDIIRPPQGVLVDCGLPVSIEARAVHHISDAMVAGSMRPDEVCRLLVDGPHEYHAAHNIDHEQKYFGGGDKKWLCTYKTALRLWPDAPGHKLQELRYFLKLDDADDFDPALADTPHRAPPDAYVCAHLLRRELKEATVEQMVRWSSGPALLYCCFMKKHKGQPWSQVAREDRDYLVWIYEKSDITDRDIRATVKYWLNQTAPAKAGA